MPRINWMSAIVTAVVSFAAGFSLVILLFGNPISQNLIYTPSVGQSPKLIAVWLTLEPIPPVSAFWDDIFVFSAEKLLVVGLLQLWGFGIVVVYAVIHPSLPGEGWRKGLSYAAMLWVTVAFFFEVFTPLNLFGEPFALILYELTLWALSFAAIGILIALLYRPLPLESSH